MCARNECDKARLRRLTTTRTVTCSPSASRHCWFSCALCWSWFSRCHWCPTSHRSAGRFYTSKSFHHAYAISSTKFFSSGCCSPTLSCHRQLNMYPKFFHISHREDGSFEVLSLQQKLRYQRWGKLNWRVQMSLMTVAWFWAPVAMTNHGIGGWSLNSSKNVKNKKVKSAKNEKSEKSEKWQKKKTFGKKEKL